MPIFIGGRLKLKGVKAIGSGSSTKKDSKKTLSASTTTTTTTTTSSKEEKKEKSSWIGKAVDVENEESLELFNKICEMTAEKESETIDLALVIKKFGKLMLSF